MNEEELKELTEKFPSVLKQALKEGLSTSVLLSLKLILVVFPFFGV